MFLINDIFVIYNFINPSCVPETLREPPRHRPG